MLLVEGSKVLQWGEMSTAGLSIPNNVSNFQVPHSVPLDPGIAVPLSQIPNLLERFRDFCRIDRGLQPRTISDHVGYVKKFLEWTGGRRLSKDLFRSYLGTIKDKYAPAQYRNRLCSFYVFATFLGRKEEFVGGLKFPEVPAKLVSIPSKEQLRSFFDCLPNQKSRMAFLTVLSGGMRRSEFFSLTRKNVNLETGVLDLSGAHKGKTKHSYMSFLNSEALPIMREWLASNTKDKVYPFTDTILWEEFKHAEQESGVRVTLQTLRQYFSDRLGEASVPDRYVDFLQGRVPSRMIARHYSDFSPAKVRAQYDKADLRILM